MPGLIQGLEIARRAMMAQQSALNVTGSNIANVNTPGYSRETAVLQATPPEDTGQGYIGTGVNMTGVQRARDNFIDTQIRQEMGLAGQWQARSDALSQVETVVSEPSNQGLSQLMDQFFSAWQDLSNSPNDAGAHAAVVSAGQSLAQGFNTLDANLQQISDATGTQISGTVTQVNQMLQQVATLNGQITAQEAGGQQAPQLRDQRDQLLDQLASLAGATHTIRPDGSVFVRIGGRKVVDGPEAQLLQAGVTMASGQEKMQVTFASDGVPLDDTTSGNLGGLLLAHNQDIPGFRSQLDQLASTVASSVNRLQQAGPSHLAFFTGATARDLSVASDVAADPTQVNASTTGDSGDNDIALAVGALGTAKLMNRGTATLSGAYTSQVSTLGSLAQQASQTTDNQAAAVSSLQARRQEVIGVNLNDELTSMITTQQAYQAAARVFSTVNSMLDTLLKA